MNTEIDPELDALFESVRQIISVDTLQKEDALYHMVNVCGPTVFGKVIKSNSGTIWDKVKKPGQFKLEEIIRYAKVFRLTVAQFEDILIRQDLHNQKMLRKGQPIAKARYELEKSGSISKSATKESSIAKKTAKSSKKKSS